jgi:hypothetical protein
MTTDDTNRMIERVNALLHDSAPGAEDTLMDGYACALALEAERARLSRCFAKLLADDGGAERVPELRSLRQRISSADEQLARLRGVLTAARRRLIAASAAAAETPVS